MPHLPLFFARRYLFSAKSHSVINLISGVSAFAVSIPVAAMVVLLSIFNGFEGMIQQMYTHFDPELQVTPRTGKIFEIERVDQQALRAIEGVAQLSFSLEDAALFEYRDRQYIGQLKGVDSLYTEVVPIDTLLTSGTYRLALGDFPEAVVGQGVAYALGVRAALLDPINVYVPRRGTFSPLLPQSLYSQESIYPSGIFMLDAEVDGKYVISSLEFAQRVLDHPDGATHLSIALSPGAPSERVQREVQELLGADFRVENRYQQKADFYRIMLYEKWGIYFIILLVLIVASFSLVGSLVMLIIDKRKDIHTCQTLGASIPLLRRIFLYEGMLIYGLGAGVGLVLGVLLALGQQTFGWITLAGDSFLLDAYPVELRLSDVGFVVLTFTAVSWCISALTVRSMIGVRQLNRGA